MQQDYKNMRCGSYRLDSTIEYYNNNAKGFVNETVNNDIKYVFQLFEK